jgi:hypothetical protein
MPNMTRFTGLIVAVPGGGSKGHSPIKTPGTQVGVDIQIPTNQVANAFQISKPDGTVIFAIGPNGGAPAEPPAPISADGPVSPAGGTFVITKAGSAAALTLAVPASNGITLVLTSQTGFAHTLTTAGLLRTGSAAINTATFAAFAGATLTLMSNNGFWNVISQVGVAFS